MSAANEASQEKEIGMATAFQVHMTSLWCEKNNDDFLHGDEDEVFLAVAGKSTSGKVYQWAFPAPDRYWNVPAVKDAPVMVAGQTLLCEDTLGPGQELSLVMVLIEEDTAVLGKALSITGSILQGSENPYAMAAGFVANILSGYPEDDVLGTTAIHVWVEDGQVKYETRGIEDASEITPPEVRDKHIYHLTGKGGKYSIGFRAI
jgi:hypothetical protein